MNEQDLSNRIRQYVDGELDPDEGAALLNRIEGDAELQARTRFEETLRENVSRAMLGDAERAPESLASQIRGALVQAEVEPEVAGRLDPSQASLKAAGADESAREDARRPWFAGPQRANFLAVAAVLTLITSVVLFSIFSPQIDDRAAPAVGDLVCEITQFTLHVHGLCADNPEIAAMKSAWPTFAEAERKLAEHLDVAAATVVDLAALGYQFTGAGKCRVPGKDTSGRDIPSGHAVYKKFGTDGKNAADLVSVFMAPNVGQFADSVAEFPPDQWLEFGCIDGGGEGVYGRTDGRLIYILVCGDPQRCPGVLETLARNLPRASGND
jgi:anti-sigma factor RsiW